MAKKQKMLECFGLNMGWFDEFGISEPEQREQCLNCHLFEPCYKMSMIRQLNNLRFEMRKSTRALRNSMGGVHSEHPFG